MTKIADILSRVEDLRREIDELSHEQSGLVIDPNIMAAVQALEVKLKDYSEVVRSRGGDSHL